MSVPFRLPVSLGRVKAEVLGMDQTCGLPVGCEALSWLGPHPSPRIQGPFIHTLPHTSAALSVHVLLTPGHSLTGLGLPLPSRQGCS